MKAVIILSGGMDSTTLLYDAKRNFDIYALSIYYGQRHKKELQMAKSTCKKLKVPHKILDISNIVDLISNSALTGKIRVPEGDYEDESMKLTVVPNRNMILLSIALGYAINIGAKVVFYGAHAGDHSIYPDCRKEFVEAMMMSAFVCHYNPLMIYAPYLSLNKTKILAKGIELGVDYSKTWTCYVGGKKPCGKCGSCRERQEAFTINKIRDPLL